MKVVIQHLNAENFSELSEAFQELDLDNTGYITTDNLGNALNSVGLKVAKTELDDIISKADYLKRGRLNYTEFMSATLDLKGKMTDQVIFDTYSHFDIQGKGHITIQDFETALK